MNICLFDADSKIPNLALMKLSAYHKNLGHNVILKKLGISYYPDKRKFIYVISSVGYDKSYCGVIFKDSMKSIHTSKDVIIGGSGYDLRTTLNIEIENCDPDYSIYPENNSSYGFITRGCIRKCKFCIVPEKEGMIRQVSSIDKIVKHKEVRFLDNNFLAFSGHKKLLKELIDKNIKCSFIQGLDIRLLDVENSQLLRRLNYLGCYTFAFDDIHYLKIIDDKLKLLRWRKPWEIRFFIYVHPDMKIDNTFYRIEWMKQNKCLPYLMRDISCWSSPDRSLYIDMASYCNQPGIFKKMSFDEYVIARHK
jgi:hypothetical protein